MSIQVVSYGAYPAVFASFVTHAPEMVTVGSGILAMIWYGMQIIKAFKSKEKDDETPPR